MKKSILLVAILAFVGAATAVAQPRAIGVNLGYGVDLSYQHSLGEANMLDVSINIPGFNGLGAKVTYDWINPFGTAIPWDYKGEWKWALGLGASGGMYNLFDPNEDTHWYVGAAAHVGVEYDFWFPLQLSLDLRPTLGVDNTAGKIGFGLDGIISGVTLGVRYLL